MIIGITGKKGSGKSTAALALTDNDDDDRFVRIAFAEPLKDMVESLLFYFGIEDMYALDKTEIIPGIGCDLRHLYQSLGTEWGRTLIHPDLWVNALALQLDDCCKFYDNVVIDDVRFENEADLIRNRGGLVIHIDRPSQEATDTHSSEAGIEFKDGDIRIINTGLDDFLHQILSAVANHG